MINNYLFRLLFDYRGTITRREYWAGLVVVLICFIPIISRLSSPSMLSIMLFDNVIWYGFSNELQHILSTVFSVELPLFFIGLYISLVVTIKRCRALGKSVKSGILIGIFTTLIFKCIYSFSHLYSLVNIYSSAVTIEVNGVTFDLESTIIVLTILFSVIILTGIISVVYMSLQRDEKDNVPVYSGCDSINYLIYMGRIILLVLFLIICIGIIEIFDFKYLNNYYIGYVLIAFFIISILIISIMRGEDAGVKPLIVILISLGFFILHIIMAYMYTIYMTPILDAIFETISKLLCATFYILGFILIALPSKEIEVIE